MNDGERNAGERGAARVRPAMDSSKAKNSKKAAETPKKAADIKKRSRRMTRCHPKEHYNLARAGRHEEGTKKVTENEDEDEENRDPKRQKVKKTEEMPSSRARRGRRGARQE
ncbi:hypothetical protein Vretimale_13243 [Volvox reticuliferus]|nr:hypothetical protein Vretimale_13243 [Volvox reticuliferus]